MSTAWVAGSVRAASLSRRRLGAAGALSLAGSPDLRSALTTLAASPYGHEVRADHTIAEAEHAVGATLLWHLRVLAGWLPRAGSDVIRLLVTGFEIANIEEHLCRLRGGEPDPPYRLGLLETSWSRIATTTSYCELRQALAGSAWGDPGDQTPRVIELSLRLAWTDRLLGGVPEVSAWARARSVMVLLRAIHLEGHDLPGQLADRARYVLGQRVADEVLSGNPPETVARQLPTDIRWVLDGVGAPADLWWTEATWWRRVESDSHALLRRAAFGRSTVIGSVGLLATDAWRVRAALETAARTSRAQDSTGTSDWAAVLGAAIAVAGSSLGAAIAVAYTGSAALAHVRAARDLRQGDGHRGAGRGHRDLRSHRRHHPDREGLTVPGRVAVIGERSAVAGYGLVGALVLLAEDRESVEAHWAGLPDDVAVVVLTAMAAEQLGERRIRESQRLTTVMTA